MLHFSIVGGQGQSVMLAGMDVQEQVLRSEAETDAFARVFARALEPLDAVMLRGGLGAGKTSFCRAVIRELCRDDRLEVPSPTFTLVQHYEAADGRALWHFDLYRIEDPDEVYETGWEEALGQAVVLVEWPERLGALLPGRRIEVTLSPVADNPDARRVEVKRYG